MPLPAASSPTLLSAFDFVGGESSAGQSLVDRAHSTSAPGSFDDLLTNELRGAEAIAFLGLNTTHTPAPIPVAPAANGDGLIAFETGSGDSHPSSAGAGDAATSLRRLILGGLPPIGSETTAATTPAGESVSDSSKPSAGELTISDASGSRTPAAAHDAAGDARASGNATEPMILSLDEHRLQNPFPAADGNLPTPRDAERWDESTRSQRLPFAPTIPPNHGTANVSPGNQAPAGSPQAPGAGLTALGDQLPAASIDTSTSKSSDGEPPGDSAELLESAAADATSPADSNADSPPDAGDVTQLTVDALVSGAVVSSSSRLEAREDAGTPRSGSPTGRIDERTTGARGRHATSADPSSFDASDVVLDAQALSAVHSGRPRPQIVTAALQVDLDQTGDDGGLPAPVSAASGFGDATPQLEPAGAEPSVVQQVSQAVETWRDALQEQGSARFAAWLSPPDLGHVWVELTRSGEGITARLKAADDAVQSLLESQEPELRQALSDSGISLSELDLSGRAAGDFASGQQHEPPDQDLAAEPVDPQSVGPVRRGSSSRRTSAIDVRA